MRFHTRGAEPAKPGTARGCGHWGRGRAEQGLGLQGLSSLSACTTVTVTLVTEPHSHQRDDGSCVLPRCHASGVGLEHRAVTAPTRERRPRPPGAGGRRRLHPALPKATCHLDSIKWIPSGSAAPLARPRPGPAPAPPQPDARRQQFTLQQQRSHVRAPPRADPARTGRAGCLTPAPLRAQGPRVFAVGPPRGRRQGLTTAAGRKGHLEDSSRQEGQGPAAFIVCPKAHTARRRGPRGGDARAPAVCPSVRL